MEAGDWIAFEWRQKARIPPHMKSITIQALADFPSLLEAHYAGIPADCKHWAPSSWDGIPSESLTAIEQICHVRDIEVLGYHDRFRRTLSELNPALKSLDTDALARDRSYATQNAEVALSEFREARSQTLALVSGLSPEQLRRPATFEGYGQLSLQSLVHYLCSHDQQHLAGLQWLLGKIEATRAPAQA
jgi:DinB family protein